MGDPQSYLVKDGLIQTSTLMEQLLITGLSKLFYHYFMSNKIKDILLKKIFFPYLDPLVFMCSICCLNEATGHCLQGFFIFLECYHLIFKHINTTPLRQRIFTEVLNVNSTDLYVCYSSTPACFSHYLKFLKTMMGKHQNNVDLNTAECQLPSEPLVMLSPLLATLCQKQRLFFAKPIIIV